MHGDFSVGKTSLLMRHHSGEFPDLAPQTWGLIFNSETRVYDETRPPTRLVYVELSTAGEERILRSYHSVQYRYANVCVMCFSLVDPLSYRNVLKKHYPHFTTYRFDVPIVLVGTKSDLVHDVDTVRALREQGEAPLTREDGVRLAEHIGAVCYLECSSVTGQGVDEVFLAAVRAALPEMKENRRCSIM